MGDPSEAEEEESVAVKGVRFAATAGVAEEKEEEDEDPAAAAACGDAFGTRISLITDRERTGRGELA